MARRKSKYAEEKGNVTPDGQRLNQWKAMESDGKSALQRHTLTLWFYSLATMPERIVFEPLVEIHIQIILEITA